MHRVEARGQQDIQQHQKGESQYQRGAVTVGVGGLMAWAG